MSAVKRGSDGAVAAVPGLVRDDETVETVSGCDLRIIQAQDGYRYAIDPFLLAAFATLPAGAKIADLGTGSGVVALLVAATSDAPCIVGLELQAALAERARRSVALNGLHDRVSVVHGDVRALPAELSPASFDIVLCNPPYRAPASGRLARGDERCRARFELAGGLTDFVAAGAHLLKNGGHLAMIFLAERLTELLVEMRRHRLEPRRLRIVHSRSGDAARLVLVEALRNGRAPLTIEPPLILYRGAGRDYSAEARAILRLPDEPA
ncbi:MAG: methyltransferase [Desulfuromonadales bacterium]|nr:methyltransferase [Desulfuromonadales bacterium]